MSNKKLNTNETWEVLFNKYKILSHIEHDGFFNISSKQINEFREARLMTKFDSSIYLPKLFVDNKLSILPVTRGDYVIGHFDAYHKFEKINNDVIKSSLPDYIQSLNVNNIKNEAMALNCAVVSDIIADFMEDSDIVATVSGRMGSGSFEFNINDTQNNKQRQVSINNSQIEIDASYEGAESFAVFEAKRDLTEDFLVRQLYYPFRTWREIVTKPVKTIFLVYSNSIYRLFEYVFDDFNNYNSLRLVKQKNYSIEYNTISAGDIQSVLNEVNIVNEPEITFPQADKFERVINICELVSAKELSRSDVTEEYSFDARQTNYYTDAARYLGLIDKRTEHGTPLYSISQYGQYILNLSFKQRQMEYCKCILSHKAFNDLLKIYFASGSMPSTKEIIEIMKNSNLYNLKSETTFIRRASTIKGWINWIVSLINE